MKLHLFYGVIPVLVTVTLFACFEPQEGCLDATATNFDAGADKDCCCEYPNLILEFRQRFGSENFDPGKVYLSSANKPFYLRGAGFYCSGFEATQQGNTYGVTDTITLRTYNTTGTETTRERFRDDYTLIRSAGQIDNKAGLFVTEGSFEALRFRLGLDALAQRVAAPLAPAGHPLAIQSTDTLWHSYPPGYAVARVVVQRDTAAANPTRDTLDFTAQDLGEIYIGKTNAAFTKKTGYDFRLILTVDYQKLLEGVDWTKGDKSAWKSRIVQNLVQSFDVSQ